MNSFHQRIQFIKKLEELKTIERMNFILGASRRENSAEHSWHLAVMALILAPELAPQLDLKKILSMLLIHDIVEIEAGDTFLYDKKETQTQHQREEKALVHLFSILPKEQAMEFMNLWHEFEEQTTEEAIFAKSLDALQPLLNYSQVGAVYTCDKPVSVDEVICSKQWIGKYYDSLWQIALEAIENCEKKGLYAPSKKEKNL